jgi:hypothetical protein
MLVSTSFLAAVALAGSQSPDPTDVTTLVMVGRSPAIHAQVNGHDAILELDTGSFELRLSPEFAQRWSIERQRVVLKLGSSPALSLRPLVEELNGPEPVPFLSAWAPHSDGIIGLDVLRRFALGIDTINGKVALWYQGRIDQVTANEWGRQDLPTAPPMSRMALSTEGPDDWFKIGARINGHPLSLLLDTGTAYSTVNRSLQRPLNLKVIGTTEVMEIGHSERLRVATADSITFGPFAAEFPVLNIESSDDEQVQGILGTEALGSGRFIIDMPGLCLYANRMPSKRMNPLERRLREAGMDLFPAGDGTLVTIVKPESPAAKLGVESGDQLISIGDVTVAEMISSFQAPSDSKRMNRLLSVGLKAFSGDLQVEVRRKDGTKVAVPLPK